MLVFWLLLNCTLRPSRLSVKPSTPQQRLVGWEWARGWEGTQLGQLMQTDQRDISYHMMSCSAIKAEGKRGEGENCYKGIRLLKQPLSVPRSYFPGIGWTSPADGK